MNLEQSTFLYLLGTLCSSCRGAPPTVHSWHTLSFIAHKTALWQLTQWWPLCPGSLDANYVAVPVSVSHTRGMFMVICSCLCGNAFFFFWYWNFAFLMGVSRILQTLWLGFSFALKLFRWLCLFMDRFIHALNTLDYYLLCPCYVHPAGSIPRMTEAAMSSHHLLSALSLQASRSYLLLILSLCSACRYSHSWENPVAWAVCTFGSSLRVSFHKIVIIAAIAT